MPINIFNEYLTKSRNNIKAYSKEILGYRYNAGNLDEILDEYFNLRYGLEPLPLGNESLNKKIMDRLNDKLKENLISLDFKYIFSWSSSLFELDEFVLENIIILRKDEEKENIEKILYEDLNIESQNRLNQIIESIERKGNFENLSILRDLVLLDLNERYFLLNKEKDIKEYFLEEIEYLDNEKKIYDNLEKNDFKIIKEYEIMYNIDFPMIYSKEVIEKVFNEDDLVREDKAILLYYLVSTKIILNLINKDFDTKYIVEFPESILGKSQKSKRLLDIIDNDNIKEKFLLKTKFKNFKENMEDIYSMLREGYIFVLEINLENFANSLRRRKEDKTEQNQTKKKNNIVFEETDFRRLQVFEYIILEKQNENKEFFEIDENLKDKEIEELKLKNKEIKNKIQKITEENNILWKKILKNNEE